MKSLKTLIKLQKQKLDVLRREMGLLEGRKAELLQMIDKLTAELKKENELAKKTQEMAAFYGDFAKRIKDQQTHIRKQVAEVDIEIGKLNDQIRVIFGEQKKYEIVLENRLKKIAAEEKRKETNELDETAVQQFTRKKKK